MLFDMSLKKKLLVSYILIIIIPVSILGYSCYFYFSAALSDKVIKNSLKNNEQIIRNIDTFLNSLAKLTEYPNLDRELNSILYKNYDLNGNIEVSRYDDYTKANSALYRGILYLNDLVDSAVLIAKNAGLKYWRSRGDTINQDYPVQDEKWYGDILEGEGRAVIVGIHKDLMTSIRNDYVVSIGRNLINPATNTSLGVLIVNVKAENLSRLWKDVSSVPGSRFILLDENNMIVFSDESSIIGKSLEDIKDIGLKGQELAAAGIIKKAIKGRSCYINVAASGYSGWRAISLIPESVLFVEVNNIGYITIFISFSLILFSIGVSTMIATSITRPVLKLKNTMKEVESGNLNVKADILGGEIGELGSSFNKMIAEMRVMIEQIYRKEKEKRNAELAVLQSQISPHFIYNTLNSVKFMAQMQGSKGIVNALGSIIELLIFTAKVKSEYISIGEEIRMLKCYVDILNLRYYNRFTVVYDIDDEVLGFSTLKFLLQPIVENSVFHGFEDAKVPGRINIKIRKVDGRIAYDIVDNGKGIDEVKIVQILSDEYAESEKKFNRIGLYNVNHRIKLSFGEDYGLYITSRSGEYTRVHVEIPAKKWMENDCE